MQDIIIAGAVCVCVGCILALGTIISFEPLDDLGYHIWSRTEWNSQSPYASSYYLGWALASVFALLITGVLPAVSWFATYRFTLSSAICIALFIGTADKLKPLKLILNRCSQPF